MGWFILANIFSALLTLIRISFRSDPHTTNDVVPAAEKFAEVEGIKGESLDLLLTAHGSMI